MKLILSAFITTVIFIPGIASAGSTPRWVFLGIVVFSVLLFLRITKTTISHIFLYLFMAYAAVSFAWTTVEFDAMNYYWHFIVLAGVFVIGAEIKDIKPVLIGCALGLILNSAATILQVLGWAEFQQVAPPGGLFMNKNVGAELSALVLVGVVSERIWWAIPGILPSIYFPWARGSLLAIAVVAVGYVGARFPKTITMVVMLCCGIIALRFIILNDSSIDQRVGIWLDTINGLSFWGNGIGSFYSKYPLFAVYTDTLKERPDHAHNDLLEIVYELGVGAVFAVAFLWSVFRVKAPTERAIILAFCVISCFGFPLYMPATAAIFFFASGCAAGSCPDLWDHRYAWRGLLHLWMVGFSQRRDCPKQAGPRGEDLPAGLSRQGCTIISGYSEQNSGYQP